MSGKRMNRSFDFDKLFERKVKLIKDPSFFDTTLYPQMNFVILRPYIVQLFKEVASFFKYRAPNNLLVIGKPGSGKTLSALHLKRLIATKHSTDTCKCYYINCRDKSSFDVVQEILGKDMRGFSINELVNIFFKQINTDIILLLDEADRAKKDLNSLLYKLSRPTERDNPPQHKIEIVLISNNLSLEESLDTALRSSMQLKVIRFDTYKEKDIFEILKQRSRAGFISNEVISEELLHYIAEIVESKRSGDSRAAIDILFEAAKDAENKRQNIIKKENIDNVYFSVIKHIEIERITRLRTHPFLVLYSCDMSKTGTPNKIYDHYIGISTELKQKSVSRAMFYHYISYLSTQNLIRFEENMDKKREFLIKVNISSELMQEEFDKRVTNLRI